MKGSSLVLLLVCMAAIIGAGLFFSCSKVDAQKKKPAASAKVVRLSVADSSCLCDTSGNFIPSGSSSGLNNTNFIRAHFLKIGNEVLVTGRIAWSSAVTAGGTATIVLVPPVGTPVFDGSEYGIFNFRQQGLTLIPYTAQFVGTSLGTVQIIFTTTVTTSGALYYSYSYTAQ